MPSQARYWQEEDGTWSFEIVDTKDGIILDAMHGLGSKQDAYDCVVILSEET